MVPTKRGEMISHVKDLKTYKFRIVDHQDNNLHLGIKYDSGDRQHTLSISLEKGESLADLADKLDGLAQDVSGLSKVYEQ